MKILTPGFLSALRKVREDVGTNRAIALQAGISEVHAARLLSGRIQLLKDDTYERLYPIVEKYIDKDKEAKENSQLRVSALDAGSKYCPAGITDTERMLMKYFRSLSDDKRIELLYKLKIESEEDGK